MIDLKNKNIIKALDTLDLIKWLNFNFHIDSRELDNIYKNFKNDDPELIVFTHWITYINDRMKKVSIKLWEKWVNFFGYIIIRYKTEISDFKDFKEFKDKIKEIRDAIEPNRNIKQIYPQDWANIVYTLWILGKFYNKSFLTFIDKAFENLRAIEKNKSELVFLGFFLTLLSYSAADKNGNLNTSYEKLTSFFKNFKNIGGDKEKIFFSYRNLNWNNWLSNKRYNSKRLMACLRDLIRAKFFIKQFKSIEKQHIEQYPNLFSKKGINWFSLDPNDLELPGDRWNIRFFLPAVIKVCSFKIKRYDNASRMTREIYDSLKSIALKNKIIISNKDFEYYPIDMDFTFWFVPKFCEKNNCDNCPFGPKGFQCEPHLENCNFYENDEIKCFGKDKCPIFNKKGMEMCGLSF
ncbi:MAG: hypothetical protein ACTSPD_15500 [Promethearchaeota archaeon]